MVHLQHPDRFNDFRWVAYVEDRHGATTIERDFATYEEACAQRKIWNDEMDRTGITIGAPAGASYES